MRWLLPIAAGLLCGLLGLYASAYVMERLDRRRKARATRQSAEFAAAWAARPKPPEPTREERIRSAVLQAASQAFKDWVRVVGTCPACGASEARPQGTPAPPPPQAPLVPAVAVATTRQGALEKERTNPQRVYSVGYHFHAFTQVLRCTVCEFTLRFPHTDDPPMGPHYALSPAKDPAAGPRVAFVIATNDGVEAGRILAGGGSDVTSDVHAGASAHGRAAVTVAAALVGAVYAGELSDAGIDDVDELRRDSVSRILTSVGASVSRVEAA